MITVYEIKPNGFIGASKEIDPREGVGAGWTYTPPPAEGAHKWENSQWVKADEPDLFTPGPDLNTLAEDARQQRNQALKDCDWTQLTDAPVDQAAWAAYRQALRDVTEQPGFPLSVEWPEQPGRWTPPVRPAIIDAN